MAAAPAQAATVTFGSVVVGNVWQFTVERTGLTNTLDLAINVWKTTGGTYPYTLVNECIFSPQASAAVPSPYVPSRATGNAIEAGVAQWMTTPTPKYASILRLMPAVLNGSPGGSSNIIDPCDLKSPDDFTYWTRNILTGSALTQNPTGQRSISITAIRAYSLSPTCIASIAVNNPGSGFTGLPTVAFSGGSGSGAAATVTVAGGAVTSIAMTTMASIGSGGSGYTAGTTVTISGGGGSGATATCTVVEGVVVAVTLTAGGSGYAGLPTVAITDTPVRARPRPRRSAHTASRQLRWAVAARVTRVLRALS